MIYIVSSEVDKHVIKSRGGGGRRLWSWSSQYLQKIKHNGIYFRLKCPVVSQSRGVKPTQLHDVPSRRNVWTRSWNLLESLVWETNVKYGAWSTLSVKYERPPESCSPWMRKTKDDFLKVTGVKFSLTIFWMNVVIHLPFTSLLCLKTKRNTDLHC